MKLGFHIFAVLLVALGTGILFLHQPQFGDDFTYWYHAFNLHERGLDAWSKDSFHQIRWPVWGVCWVLQAIFGPGLISYYGTPYSYLMLGALAAFWVGWKAIASVPAAWVCALAFLFHPLLDSIIARPMPDLGEGVLGAFAVLAWWGMMNAETPGRMVLYGIGAGVSIFVAEENRLTGLFFIPMLVCLTVLFFRQRWARLGIVFVTFAVLLFGQMAFYRWQFNRWDHFLHVNEHAKGRRGTESVAVWSLPFRFLDTLSKGGPLAPVYAALGVFGLWFGWRQFNRFARVVVAWFVLLYLAYACAPQQLWPYRPLLRDADRFLAGLAIPYAVLVVFGLIGLLQLLAVKWPRFDLAVLRRRALLIGITVFALMAVLSGQPIGDRDFFTLGYVSEFRAHMRALPDKTRVFTHHHMRALAHLVDVDSARRFLWFAHERWILDQRDDLEKAAAQADEFWYIRKLALLRSAKDISSGKLTKQPPLGSYLDHPEQNWQLARVLAKDDTPDVVLYRRRRPDTPPPLIFEAASPELQGLLPKLPYDWKPGDTKEVVESDWRIPAVLRGKLVRIEMQGTSDERMALAVHAAFRVGGRLQPPYHLKPYFYKEGGKEFVAIPVPADAESCHFAVRFDKATEWIRITDFRIIADDPNQSRGR